MGVDVEVRTVVRRPRDVVAAFAGDPANAPRWYANICSVEWRPFPMETTYTWESVDPGATRMSLRNRGAPQRFSRLLGPVMGIAVRRATRKDLARLKALLEG